MSTKSFNFIIFFSSFDNSLIFLFNFQDTINAWEDFRVTGLHMISDRADDWLAELEQGKDLEPPECHV